MDENFEEMEMPTPCQRCNEIFDLNDGYGSNKWFPNTVICENCYEEEKEEIERDEEIQELNEQIQDAEYTIKEARKRLSLLGVDIGTQITIKSC